MGRYEKWADVPFGGELKADSTIKLPSLSVTMGGSSLVMPYNYIPFFKAPAQDPDLREGDSPGREEWRPGHYSGEIQLVWRAERPLIVAELGGETPVGVDGIGVYDVPCDPEGRPRVQGTATRGPLRNLFAAVTGSRLDAPPQEEPLTYRDGNGRHGYPKAPVDLLPTDLLPPKSPSEMSPVQRVFGTVQEAATPFERASLIEFGDLECDNEQLPQPGGPWTLAIQGQPKPTYGRFTLVHQNGNSMTGVGKTDLFQEFHRLAGRGVWLHHATAPARPPTDGWAYPAKTEGGRSYLATPGANHTQVIQISGWIPPGAEFRQRLTFTNLKPREFGALLWLVDKPSYHHIGRMRGFGFGSVTVRRTSATVFTGESKRQSLLSLRSSGTACSEANLGELVNDFDSWLSTTRPDVRRSVLVASQPFPSVRYPTLPEYTAAEKPGSRPSRPRLSSRGAPNAGR